MGDEAFWGEAEPGWNTNPDAAEAAQLQPFVPQVAAQQGMPWWQALITYGATRAIDNRFGPVQVAGNVNPGTFAGQNGRTYQNTPNNTSGLPVQRAQAQQQQQSQGLGTLAVLGALAAAFL